MSSSSTFHSGLTFATLVVQFAMTRGAAVPSLAPRKGGKGTEDPTGSPATNVIVSSAVSGQSSSSSSSTSATSSITPSSSSSASSSSSSSSSSAISSSPSSAVSSSPRPVIRSDITTAGIVGVVIGSVAILIVSLMLLAKCVRRTRRKAQEGGQGSKSGFLRVGSSSPARQPTPTTEMSQTQSSPLVSSAVVAGATTNPLLSRYSLTNTTASLSPLFPVASLHHSHSLTSTSDRSASHASGGHTDVTSHDALSYMSSSGGSGGQGQGLLPMITRAAIANDIPELGSPASDLHRAMTNYQKSLENDSKGIDVGHMHTDKGEETEDVRDPPPSYNA